MGNLEVCARCHAMQCALAELRGAVLLMRVCAPARSRRLHLKRSTDCVLLQRIATGFRLPADGNAGCRPCRGSCGMHCGWRWWWRFGGAVAELGAEIAAALRVDGLQPVSELLVMSQGGFEAALKLLLNGWCVLDA